MHQYDGQYLKAVQVRPECAVAAQVETRTIYHSYSRISHNDDDVNGEISG
jgi:hypothetical protein